MTFPGVGILLHIKQSNSLSQNPPSYYTDSLEPKCALYALHCFNWVELESMKEELGRK